MPTITNSKRKKRKILISSNYFYKKSSGKVIENREVKEDIKISTNNNLFKIEYTNPYYYEDLGQYVCVAFINKNQAFDFVKPKLDIGKNTFLQSYADALSKDSILESVIGIYNAHKNLYDFYEVYDFARAINPKKSEVYEQVDALAKESLLKLKELSSKVSVRIEGVGNKKLIDDSGIIVELSEQFEELDFVVVSSFDAIYVATVEIKSTIKKTAKTCQIAVKYLSHTADIQAITTMHAGFTLSHSVRSIVALF